MTSLLNLPCVKQVLSGAESADAKKKTDRREYHRQYHLLHKDEITARKKARAKEISKVCSKYYQAHKAEISQRGSNWYQRNRKKVLERARKRRLEKAAIKKLEVANGTRQLTGRDKAVEDRRQKRENAVF